MKFDFGLFIDRPFVTKLLQLHRYTVNISQHTKSGKSIVISVEQVSNKPV